MALGLRQGISVVRNVACGLLLFSMASHAAAIGYSITPQSPTNTNPDQSGPLPGVVAGSGGATPSGAFHYQIPIELPPGINGMVPRLAAEYSSQAGTGILGRGWSLGGLSTITRCPQTIAQNGANHPVNLSATDRFCLDGQQLVLDPSSVTAGYGASGTVYHTEIDNHSRIVANGGTNNVPASFTVTTKDGRTLVYGVTLNANAMSGTTRVAGSIPMVWALSQETDRWGNYFTVTYVTPSDTSGNALGELLVNTIAYTGNASQSPLMTVVFQYSPYSSSANLWRPAVHYVAGSLQTLDQVLSGIQIVQGGTTVVQGGVTVVQGGTILRNYNFTYSTYTPANGAAYLDALDPQLAYVQKCAGSTCFPSTQIQYSAAGTSQGQVGKTSYFPTNYVSPETSAVETNSYYYAFPFMLRPGAFADFNGDGYSDLAVASLWTTPTEWIHVTILNGTASSASTGSSTLRGIPKSISNTVHYDSTLNPLQNGSQFQVADIDHDGHPDLVYVGVTQDQVNYQIYYPAILVSRSDASGNPAYTQNLSANGGWAASVTQAVQFDQRATPHVVLEDVDGDGYPDLVEFTYFTDSSGVAHGKALIVRNKGYLLAGSTTRPQLDAAGWFDWSTAYSIDLGSALNFGMPASTADFSNYGSLDIKDVDGDGLPDIVAYSYAPNSGAFTVWKNQSTLGNATSGPSFAFSATSTAQTFGTADSSCHFTPGTNIFGFWADMNGDGVPDFTVINSPTTICTYLGTGNGTLKNPAVSSFTALTGNPTPVPIPMDINMDGKMDLVFVTASAINGASMAAAIGQGDGTYTQTSSGFISFSCNSTSTWCEPNETAQAGSYMPYAGMDAGGKSYVGVLYRRVSQAHYPDPTSSGVIDLDYYDRHNAAVSNNVGLMLNVVTDGLQKKTTANYAALTDPAYPNLYPQPAPAASPDQQQADFRGAAPVVREVDADNSLVYPNSPSTLPQTATTYTYANGRISLNGRGFLGFGTVNEQTAPPVTQPDGTTVTNTAIKTTTYLQFFPCIGQPGEVDSSVKIGSATSAISVTKTTVTPVMQLTAPDGSTTTSSCTQLAAPASLPAFATAQSSVATAQQYNVDTGNTFLATTTSNRTYDVYGNVTSETSTTSATGSPTFTTTTTRAPMVPSSTSYLNYWYVDLLDHQTVTQTRSDQTGSHNTNVTYSYDPVSLFKVNSKVEQAYDLPQGSVPAPTDTKYGLKTAYTYDQYGNVVTTTASGTGDCSALASILNVTAPGCSVTGLTRTDDYSATASYPQGMFKKSSSITVTHYPDNQTAQASRVFQTQWTYDPATGAPLQEIAPDQTSKQYTYDALGQITNTSKLGSDGKPFDSIGVARTLCSAVNSGCLTGEAEKITTTVLGSAPGVSYVDRLGREVRKSVIAFDGVSTISTLTEYDELGRVRCESQPGVFSTTAYTGCNGNLSGWTYTAYDAYGRKASTRAPDGAVTQLTYSGLTTTSTNALSQVRQETRDILGRTSVVVDGSGSPSVSSITYAYDIAGNLQSTTDSHQPTPHSVVMSYNPLGRKIGMTDPDMGAWSYVYDVLGNRIQQVDAKGQITDFFYDELGRLYTRVEPDLTSNWEYDDTWLYGSGMRGALATAWTVHQQPNPANNYTDYRRIQWYDVDARGTDTVYQYGAPAQTGSRTYSQRLVYDTQANRVSTLVYNAPEANYTAAAVTPPSPLGYVNGYTTKGYLSQVTDYKSGKIEWQANVMDVQGHVTDFTLGNGLTTRRTFDLTRSELTAVVTGTAISNCGTGCQSGLASAVQNDSYGYDILGNMVSRNRAINNLQETFGYDALNRVISVSTLLNGVNTPVNVSYDDSGNIVTKSDVSSGQYNYGACGGAHRVCSITNTGITFAYDANGNLTSGNGRTYQDNFGNPGWLSYNMPGKIIDTASGSTEQFLYNGEHDRIQHVVAAGGVTTTTYYVNPRVDLGGHFEETVTQSGTNAPTTEYTHYVYAGSEVVGTLVSNSSGVSTDWSGTLATAPTTANPNSAGITLPTSDPGVFSYTAPTSSSPGQLNINSFRAGSAFTAIAKGQRLYNGGQSVVLRARLLSGSTSGSGASVRIGLVNDGNTSDGSKRSVELVLQNANLQLQATLDSGAITPVTVTGSTFPANVVMDTSPERTCVYVYADGDYLGSSTSFQWCAAGSLTWNAGGTHQFSLQMTGYTFTSPGSASLAVTALSETTGDHRFFQTDSLGSIAVVTDYVGMPLESLSYDTWGRRRALDGNPTEAWTENFANGWNQSTLLPPASDPAKVISYTQPHQQGLQVAQLQYSSAYQATATGARRYADGSAVTFSGQIALTGSQGYVKLGVGNNGSTSDNTRRDAYVVWNNGQFQVQYRSDSNPGTEQSVNVSTATTGTYNVSVVTTFGLGTQVYLWLSTQSQPTTPTWSTTAMTWGAGAGKTKALEIVGQTLTTSTSGTVYVDNLSENVEYLGSLYAARHGFTGHEHLESIGLIDMNGRVFDPTVARFLSADPNIQDPFGTQSYNRYTYVNNNPMTHTDPSGYVCQSDGTGCDEAVLGSTSIQVPANIQFNTTTATSHFSFEWPAYTPPTQGWYDGSSGIQTFSYIGRFAQGLGGFASTGLGANLMTVGGVSCLETGVGCLGIPIGGALVFMGADQGQAAIRGAPTFGSEYINNLAFDGQHPIISELLYGSVDALANAAPLMLRGVTAADKAASGLPEGLNGLADPNAIRFTQDSIGGATFKDGTTLQSTIDGLRTGTINPADIPAIRVFQQDGLTFTLDNRRLFASSEAGVPVNITPATAEEITDEAWKMTTPNQGCFICIRGASGD